MTSKSMPTFLGLAVELLNIVMEVSRSIVSHCIFCVYYAFVCLGFFLC